MAQKRTLNRHSPGTQDSEQAEEKQDTERERVEEKKKTEFTTSAATSAQSLIGREFKNVDISVGPKSGHSLAQLTGALKA